MALCLGLHLISKLRYDSALYFLPPENDRRHKYGEKVNPRNLPQEYLIHTHCEDDWRFDHYNLQVLHKQFAQPINVVIIVKTNIKTGEQGHVILFSTDLNLKGDKLVELYSLRFQIEFNFRDAPTVLGIRRLYECITDSCNQCS